MGKNTSHRNEKRLLFFTQAWNKENNPAENENPVLVLCKGLYSF